MIVEDELLLRLDLANQLHSAGFEVIGAQCADEALKLLATNIDVDLILTDIRMPGQIDGLGLVSSVHRQDRDFKLICRRTLMPTANRPQMPLLRSPCVSEPYSLKFDNYYPEPISKAVSPIIAKKVKPPVKGARIELARFIAKCCNITNRRHSVSFAYLKDTLSFVRKASTTTAFSGR